MGTLECLPDHEFFYLSFEFFPWVLDYFSLEFFSRWPKIKPAVKSCQLFPWWKTSPWFFFCLHHAFMFAKVMHHCTDPTLNTFIYHLAPWAYFCLMDVGRPRLFILNIFITYRGHRITNKGKGNLDFSNIAYKSCRLLD